MNKINLSLLKFAQKGAFMKKRIWELDTARGICIFGMVIMHLLYDIDSYSASFSLSAFPLLQFIKNWGGVLFFLISGICITLGSRPVRRGLIVCGAGLLVTGVTYGMYALRFAGEGIIIWFGVLHCLGVCMLLWPAVRRLPVWALGILAVTLIGTGFYLDTVQVDFPWLIPLGLATPNFFSSDYFPLLPFFGFFLAGAVVGKTLYRRKETLFPQVDPRNPVLRFFSFLGKWSLPVYLLHQPVLTGILTLISML